MPDSVAAKTFNTHPDSPVAAESPLHWSYKKSGLPKPGTRNGVILHERPFFGHLLLRGSAVILDRALRHALSISLPGEPLTMSYDSTGSYNLQWLGPDEWLLIVPPGEEFTVENKLREVLGAEHYAITNVSGGQTIFELQGESAGELLMKSTVYDVHSHNFPVGKGVATVFAKAAVILRRPSEECWQLVVRRSFSDYIYRWLLDAGEEYQLGVKI